MTALSGEVDTGGFSVHLDNFSGPFDLLLQLIGKHKLDITEVALSRVTDEFIAHLRQAQATQAWDLNETSQFIVVGATLLDLKAARLLPQGEVDDEEDLALLEARDLLFARLLQYRAFKLVSRWMAETLAVQDRRHPRPGGLEEYFARLLPEVDLSGMAERLAQLAGAALAPKAPVEVELSHLHIPRVSVRDQGEVIIARLKEHLNLSFRALVADTEDRLVVVARFLALLELYREQAVAFEQLTPLGELTIRWLGTEVVGEIGAEFDQAVDAPAAEAPAETRIGTHVEPVGEGVSEPAGDPPVVPIAATPAKTPDETPDQDPEDPADE